MHVPLLKSENNQNVKFGGECEVGFSMAWQRGRAGTLPPFLMMVMVMVIVMVDDDGDDDDGDGDG